MQQRFGAGQADSIFDPIPAYAICRRDLEGNLEVFLLKKGGLGGIAGHFWRMRHFIVQV